MKRLLLNLVLLLAGMGTGAGYAAYQAGPAVTTPVTQASGNIAGGLAGPIGGIPGGAFGPPGGIGGGPPGPGGD